MSVYTWVLINNTKAIRNKNQLIETMLKIYNCKKYFSFLWTKTIIVRVFTTCPIFLSRQSETNSLVESRSTKIRWSERQPNPKFPRFHQNTKKSRSHVEVLRNNFYSSFGFSFGFQFEIKQQTKTETVWMDKPQTQPYTKESRGRYKQRERCGQVKL